MSSHPQQSTGENFALRLKAFYAALFITLGVQMPFLPVWLTAKGLDAEAVGFAQGMIAIMILYALASAAYTPVMMLADTYALRGLARRGRAYGPVRLWGSAAFIVASFSAGALLNLITAHDVIWLIVATMALTTAAGLMLAPLDKDTAEGSTGRPSATWILRDSSFLA